MGVCSLGAPTLLAEAAALAWHAPEGALPPPYQRRHLLVPTRLRSRTNTLVTATLNESHLRWPSLQPTCLATPSGPSSPQIRQGRGWRGAGCGDATQVATAPTPRHHKEWLVDSLMFWGREWCFIQTAPPDPHKRRTWTQQGTTTTPPQHLHLQDKAQSYSTSQKAQPSGLKKTHLRRSLNPNRLRRRGPIKSQGCITSKAHEMYHACVHVVVVANPLVMKFAIMDASPPQAGSVGAGTCSTAPRPRPVWVCPVFSLRTTRGPRQSEPPTPTTTPTRHTRPSTHTNTASLEDRAAPLAPPRRLNPAKQRSPGTERLVC